MKSRYTLIRAFCISCFAIVATTSVSFAQQKKQITDFMTLSSASLSPLVISEPSEKLPPGWVEVRPGRWENPFTGEYCQLTKRTTLKSGSSFYSRNNYSESLDFEFKIRHSFTPPTKFLASSDTATVDTTIYTTSDLEEVERPSENGFKYAVSVGPRYLKLIGGEVESGTVKRLRSGRKYSVTISNRQRIPAYTHLEGTVSVN